MIQAILAFVILVGLGFILGYLTKQDDAYERGYFFGRADGRTEVFNLFKKEEEKNILNNKKTIKNNMTNEQFERLKPYEQELKWAHRQNFLSMANGKFNELMVIYKELYNSELNKSQRACGTCRLRAVKRIAADFFDHAQNLAIAEKEERLKESTEEDKPKKKAGRPRKINLEG